jgi:hypothetical protein
MNLLIHTYIHTYIHTQIQWLESLKHEEAVFLFMNAAVNMDDIYIHTYMHTHIHTQEQLLEDLQHEEAVFLFMNAAVNMDHIDVNCSEEKKNDHEKGIKNKEVQKRVGEKGSNQKKELEAFMCQGNTALREC